MASTDDILARRRSELASRRGTLSALKQQELERLLNKSVAEESPRMIPARPAGEPAPLSFAQERLWFLYQLEPESTAYNVCFPLRITGRLNLAALNQSINEAVRRHESLRTTFEAVDGRPVQIINAAQTLDLPIVDLSSLSGSEAQDVVQKLVYEAGARRFNLAERLFQPALFRIAKDEHILLVLMHHIIFDEWSRSLLVREVGEMYQTFDQGYPSPVPDLSIQYADYARWHRDLMRDEVLESELSYWREQLDGMPEMMNLPVDRPRPPLMTYDGDALPFVVPAPLTEKLRDLTRSSGTSLFMTMLASFQMLLSRYTGQDDVVVATPVAGRRSVETEDLIGFFVNTLLIRTRLDGNPTVKDVLDRVREVVLEAQTHQDLPFEKLVEDLHPERSLSHVPLSEVMFVFTNKPRTLMEVQDISMSLVEMNSSTEKFGLSLEISEGFQELNCLLSYRTDLFDRSTIERLSRHWLRLLDAMVTEPNRLLSRVELLDEAEKAQIVTEWNDTAVDYPQGQLLHQLFEEQAARSPRATALIFGEEQLTYGELDRRATRLAAYLRTCGVGPDVLVGICMERSVEMAVALLGILKAGGAYVPLDPAYPSERLAFMLADSGLSVLLTQQRLVETLPSSSAQIVSIDADWHSIEASDGDAPAVQITSDNLAYVIYTSGSTGQPQGAMVHHGGVINCLRWMQQTYKLDETDNFLLQTSLNFDPSVWELFWPLWVGASVCIARPGGHRDTGYLANEIRERGITSIYFVPSMLRVFLDEPRINVCGSLKRVICGGEALPLETIDRFYKLLPAELHHSYGPTETSIAATEWTCEPQTQRRAVPIGFPLANTQTYVVDRNMNLAPTGVLGELFIGGLGLGRGYLNRAELTSERFIPDLFGNVPGARLYRSGDLVRYLPDGSLEFAGRLDHQVKIRGFRIELGEIEAQLSKHPAIRETIVIAREDKPREKRLVAYLVSDQEQRLAIGEVREFLKERLPEYMIPAAFVVLDAFPLMHNGKVDRRRLPEPEQTRPEGEQLFVAPRTAVDEMLAVIWCEVLGLNGVGVNDNFFDLGGHSLLATRVTSRIRDAFHVELPVRVIFESPTIAELGARLEQLTQSPASKAVEPLRTRPAEAPLTVSYAQEHLWFLDQLLPGSNAYNQPVAMHISADLNTVALEQAFAEVVRRHEALRTTFVTAEGYPQPVIGPTDSIKLAFVDLQTLNNEERDIQAARLRDDDALRPFDLAKGPLLRVTLVRMSADQYLLLTNVHHIVSDGWSLEVLLQETEILYRAFSNGAPSSVAELPVQYSDYAYWQRNWLQGEVLEDQINYWRNQLAGAPTLLELQPADASAVKRIGQSASHRVEFSPELSRSLREFSRREGSTIFMTLMTGFHALLRRYTDQKDIIVGTPMAGRNRAELEPLIGFFVNMVALRTNFDDEPSFRELLKQVRDHVLGAYAHQDVPFERLVEELKPERAVGRNPIFQVMFALQNAQQPTMQMEGVSAPVGMAPSPETKFDLEVFLQDTPKGFTGSFGYNPALFEPAFVGRMVQRFERLMEKVLTEPNTPLSSFSLLDETEYRQAVEEWNDTTVALPDASIPQLFEQEMALRPDAIAVDFDQENLSYRELNRRANALALQLQRLGVEPEVFVGVMLERSTELIVSFLGISKAGGVYVPINLADPRKRIQFILEDANIKVLITTRLIAAGFGETDLTLLYVDDFNESLAADEPVESVVPNITPDNLFYLMYTSGSTGMPKGVGITHRNVVRLVKGADYAELTSDEILFLFSAISFDVSTFEIWGSLLNGGRLVVFLPHLPSIAELADYIDRRQVTTLWLTSALFHQLVDDGSVRRLGTLKQFLAGGEALSPIHVTKALEQINSCRLINGYGPTETTTFACSYHITPGFPGPSVPIGHPISNTTAYVLNNATQLLGVGERGELFVGGPGLGRGYHKRPDLTAERFMPDAYGSDPGGRLYRTGDAASYLDEGIIRFLGRVDDQIKLSGFRIEPAEIQTILSEHPTVSKAFVLTRETSDGDKRLIAYVVPSDGATVSSEELKAYLRERLPKYMVPSAWVSLDELPLTPNNKVDRAALPDPEISRLESTVSFEAPRSQTQEILAGIWERVLGLERVARTDNFFSLGGYSLLATRIISRIRESFKVELPVRSIFESPVLEELAERINEAMRSGQTLVAPPLKRVTTLERLPLSYAQQRLWFLDQLTPDNSAYNIPVGFRVKGPINVSALEQSLNEIVKRHESLRTNFLNVDGEPIQVIAPPHERNLTFISLEQFAEPEREFTVEQLALAEGQKSFDLASDPLFRTVLFRLAPHEHVLLVVMHHIISDGWSIDLLLREATQIYTALTHGRTPKLPELPIQYADFAHWQRSWLQGAILDQELSYWRNQLAGIPPELNLPTDRPRPSALSLKGNAVRLEVPQSLTERLRTLSQSEGSTLFITLLASFQMLLARYSGQDDIPVGTPVAGRRWVETEDIVGFFVNTLVMRARLHGNPSIREVLQRVREVTLEAQTHQDVPFEKLVEELQPERTLSHGPLFQTMFVFLNSSQPEPVEEGLAFSNFELNFGSEKNDLTLQVIEQQDRLIGSLSYSTDLFDESTIRRMTDHWSRILETIASNPEQSLQEIELLNDEERRQMLVQWNNTAREFPENLCVHELFQRQVQLTPDAAAVSFGDQQLTYAELDRRTNQLAHYLLKAGVGPETPVPIYLERSVDLIVALLGVLKAGGAYLPLETTHPKGRVQYVLNDAHARVILAHEPTATMLPETTARVICLDSDWSSIANESNETPFLNTTPDNLAYVIYTSGSTGGARGVMVQHRSVSNLATTLREKVYPADAASLRVSVNAPLMFDSSVKQLVQLLNGHELCVIPEDVRVDGEALAEYLRLHEIDVLDCTPSQLRMILPTGLFTDDAKAPALVLVGGEAIDDETWQQLAAAPRTRFFNVYGPTECTVDTTVQRVEPSTTEVLIGRPLDNVQTYVLDTNDRPVPVGVSAELVIGGAGVARGYLSEPDLTAERFIPDSLSGHKGARLYRSGDRVRYRPGGEISFLGRLDYQVKIRGHRIELGEIEVALRKDPQVREAVVVEREEQRGDKRLVAYLVGEHLSLTELQQGLREQLPDYMMPTAWIMLDEIPLTPNGKVDRAALPEPGRTRLESAQGFAVPPTLIEEALAAIWQQVLGLDEVDRDDNFFWLGGHSLLATRIISRIRESFQIELPVRSVFESPTLEELSQRIESVMRSGASKAAPPISPIPEADEIPLSYAQQRLWFLNQLMPGSNAYNLPAEMVINAQIIIGAMQQAFSEVIRRHEALRTTFVLPGAQPAQRINSPAALELPLTDLRGLNPDEARAVADRLREESTLRPFDLETGPLVRARLVRVDEQEYLFLLNMHHIVSDGWSMGVLLHEVETLYRAYAHGLPSPLPELDVQYGDYAQWQREWLQGEVLTEEVAFWKKQLEGAPTLLELETDRPRQLMRNLRGAQHSVVFSPEVSQWLREFHRQEGATLFMTLMAGFHALLWRYTGQSDILVGTPVAGRSRVELEPLIGFFVNMIPIRTNFTKSPTFRQLVNQVRDASLAAYTHQELPFDKLVEELQPKRAPGRNPIFQAILAFQNAQPQMSVAKVNMPAGAPVSADVKFDLEVHLSDGPNGVAGSFVYSPELFDPAFIQRMVYHFQQLFEKAMHDPDSELSTLSLLDEAEYRQVVEEWNDTAVPVPQGAIHDIFKHEVEQRPDAIALEFGDQQISYRELDQRANRLARRLQREGVGRETFVGVKVERSVELIVALLGVAKAGGVYVPLSLTDPVKRIEFILEDAGVKTVVTTKAHGGALADRDLTLVYIDEVSEETSANLATDNTEDNLAYLMYTSGSTGQPKGVGITHRNIVGFVKAANYAEMGPDDIFLHLAPISFDASTFEIWAALLNGARLVVYPSTVPSLSELGELITRTQVTTLFLTTGLFHHFVDTSVSNIGAVRQLLTGGDALSPALLQKGLEQIENVTMVNCYGPTESTVMACTYRVERDRPATSVPIGRPVSNTRLYIVNANHPVGVGERGELFIGGHGLGRGYHNRPDLTAERFLPDPYGPQPGARLYRTGDAARYQTNGLIQFLGRVDDQVKLSGFRIEPREIEAVLSTHPSLRAAVVVAREETPGQKFLVAYFVPNSETALSSDELRSYLKERLPDYMVPSVFMPLEAVPLTPHGKVDRAALPAPDVSLNRANKQYVAPANDLQQQLVDIWEELFKIHPIGVTDNFFELGGHSLQMIMLVTRVEERLGKRVAMAELFEDPTVEHLAQLVGHGKESLFQSLIVPLQSEGTQPAFFGPHASGGNVWVYKELVQHLGTDQPFFGVQPREPENGMVVYHNDVESMATDYVQAVRGFQPEGPYWLAGWSMGGVIAFEMARQLQQQGQEVAMLALMDATVPEADESEYNWAILLSIFAFDLGLTEENFKRPSAWTPVPQMAQLRQLWVEARRAGVVPSEMTLVEFRKLFDVFKIHANTLRRYKAGEFQGRITLFSPAEDVEQIIFNRNSADAAMERENPREVDPLKGWGKLATDGVDLHQVPGNHFTMLREPNVQALGEQLRECIEQTQARRNGGTQ